MVIARFYPVWEGQEMYKFLKRTCVSLWFCPLDLLFRYVLVAVVIVSSRDFLKVLMKKR